MERSIKNLPLLGGGARITTTITEPANCLVGSPEAFDSLVSFLRVCLGSPSVLMCGHVVPSSIQIKHDGIQWVMKTEGVG